MTKTKKPNKLLIEYRDSILLMVLTLMSYQLYLETNWYSALLFLISGSIIGNYLLKILDLKLFGVELTK